MKSEMLSNEIKVRIYFFKTSQKPASWWKKKTPNSAVISNRRLPWRPPSRRIKSDKIDVTFTMRSIFVEEWSKTCSADWAPGTDVLVRLPQEWHFPATLWVTYGDNLSRLALIFMLPMTCEIFARPIRCVDENIVEAGCSEHDFALANLLFQQNLYLSISIWFLFVNKSATVLDIPTYHSLSWYTLNDFE